MPTDVGVLDAGRRNGRVAAEHRTALRRCTMPHSPQGGGKASITLTSVHFPKIPQPQ